MQRRSYLLVVLVVFFANIPFQDVAFAQFAGVNWKRWDWSILNPGDEASSTVARILGSGDSSEHRSVGMFAAEPLADLTEESDPGILSGLGKCQVASFANQFSRVTHWLQIQLVGISKEFRSTSEAWLFELQFQCELIYCAKAALLARTSQKEALEYWNYYEDRSLWLRGSKWDLNRVSRDWGSEDLAKLERQNIAFEIALGSLSCFPGKQISSIAIKSNHLLNWSTVQLLELNEQLVNRLGWWSCSQIKMSCVFRNAAEVFYQFDRWPARENAWLSKQFNRTFGMFAAATTNEALRALLRIELAVRSTVSGAVSVLSLIPVEAIGYVLAD